MPTIDTQKNEIIEPGMVKFDYRPLAWALRIVARGVKEDPAGPA